MKAGATVFTMDFDVVDTAYYQRHDLPSTMATVWDYDSRLIGTMVGQNSQTISAMFENPNNYQQGPLRVGLQYYLNKPKDNLFTSHVFGLARVVMSRL